MKISFKFNMVEIALAIVVLAIGLSSILVLFPIGINATRAAMEANLAPEMEEFVVNYVRSEYLKHWYGQKTASFTAPDPLELTLRNVSTRPETPANFSQAEGNEVTTVKAADGTVLVKLAKVANGVYKYTSGDFIALIKCWKPANDLTSSGDAGQCPLYIHDTIKDFSGSERDGVRQEQNTFADLKYKDSSNTETAFTAEYGKFAQSLLIEFSWVLGSILTLNSCPVLRRA